MFSITEVRVKLARDTRRKALRAFCSITLDGALAIHDLRIVEGIKGLFISMPNRRICDYCNECGQKNPLQSEFCCKCGVDMGEADLPLDGKGRPQLYCDVAHPIHNSCRKVIEDAVILAYHQEVKRDEELTYRPDPVLAGCLQPTG